MFLDYPNWRKRTKLYIKYPISFSSSEIEEYWKQVRALVDVGTKTREVDIIREHLKRTKQFCFTVK